MSIAADLRRWSSWRRPGGSLSNRVEGTEIYIIFDTAADRIEALEDALRRIEELGKWPEPFWALAIPIAREALGDAPTL